MTAPVAPPPSMGRRDLVLYLAAAGISLRWLALAAAAGPSSLVLWGAASLCFQIPLCLTVVELATRFPGEGGMYRWSREAFGDRAAFLTGWLYWASNIPFFPALLYFAAANALWIGGDAWRPLEGNALWFAGFALAALAGATWLNVRGLRHAKWLANLGALGTWLPVLLLAGLAWLAWRRGGSATDFAAADWRPATGLRDLAFFSALVFGFGGAETASFITAELRAPKRDLPWGIAVSAVTVLVSYVLGTFAMLVLLPAERLSGLEGIMQAIAAGAARADAAWLVPIFAALITLSAIGALSAWLTAVARLPFVGGMEGYLPASLGALHPRHGTPSRALWWMAGIAGVTALLSQAGQSVRGAYDVLVAMTTVAYFIPYLFAFAALLAVQDRPAGPEVRRVPGGRLGARVIGGLGLLTTAGTLVLAFVPPAEEPRPLLAAAKIAGLSAVLVGVGLLLGRRRRPVT